MALIRDTAPPPWHGYFTEGPYKGRRTWWGALGYDDPVVEQGRWRPHTYRYEEEDPRHRDPPITDSFINANGEDGYWGADPLYKTAQDHRSLPQFQKDMYENSAQIKDIKAKYNISPEHPGMKYLANFSGGSYFDYPWKQGVLGGHGLFVGFRHWGPRFNDGPINEQCGVKALALAKYTAHAMLIPAYYSMMFNHPGVMPRSGIKLFFKEWARLAPLPVASLATWGGMVCLAADYRQKADCWNFSFATLCASIVYGAGRQSLKLGGRALYLGLLASTGAYLVMYQEMGHSGSQAMRDQFSVWNHEKYLDWRKDKEFDYKWRVPKPCDADRPWYDSGWAGFAM